MKSHPFANHPTLGPPQPLESIRECQFDPEDLLTPKQFAKLAGTSEAALRHEHVRGYFRAAFCDPGGGRAKERRYTVQQLSLYRARKGTVEYTDDYSGAQAQQCFRAFADGKDVKFCISEFGLHPNVAEQIREAWVSCDGGLLVNVSIVEAIRALPHDGPDKIKTGEDLLEVVKSLSIEALCSECSKRARKVCLACANKRRRTPPAAPISESKSAAE